MGIVKSAAKNILSLVPLEKRLGKDFIDAYNFLEESQWWTEKEINEFQNKKIISLIEFSYENVPFYRQLFDYRGLKPKQIQSFEDIEKIPFLTKEIINQNRNALIAESFPKKKLLYATTGGSTGNPLGFYREKRKALAIELAFMYHQWSRVGYQIGERTAILRGNIIKAKDKIWDFDPLYNSLILSVYDMNDYNIQIYLRKIFEFKPMYIQAYPSAITIISKFIIQNSFKLGFKVKAILCGSENLYKWQRELIEKAFRCRVFSWYGHSEQVALAGECEKSNKYHVFPEYGYFELINNHNKSVKKDDEVGEIVSTGFINKCFPLIRYKTEDLARNSIDKCNCNRKHKLINGVEGRKQELVFTNDRRPITLTALIFSQHFHAFDNIKEMQLEQEEFGNLIINIVKGIEFNEDDEFEIKNKLKKATRNGIEVKINYVDFIERLHNGKYKFLKQRIKI